MRPLVLEFPTIRVNLRPGGLYSNLGALRRGDNIASRRNATGPLLFSIGEPVRILEEPINACPLALGRGACFDPATAVSSPQGTLRFGFADPCRLEAV
jgi:hypothetical protein